MKLLNILIKAFQFILINLCIPIVIVASLINLLIHYIRTGELESDRYRTRPGTFKSVKEFDNKKYILALTHDYRIEDLLFYANFPVVPTSIAIILKKLNLLDLNNNHYVILERLKVNDDWIPTEFICPISREIINGIPARSPFNSKHHYDFLYLLGWLMQQDTDILTRQKVRIIDYKLNVDLKHKIDLYIHFLKYTLSLLNRMHPIFAKEIIFEAYRSNFSQEGLLFKRMVVRDVNESLEGFKREATLLTS